MTLKYKSMLITAIRSNDIAGLKSILDTVQPCNRLLSTEGLGYRMLQKSIEYNRTDITRLLLDRGCCAYEASFIGDSPLHMILAKRNSLGLVKRLLERGARVDQRNRWNETALHVAFNTSANDRVMRMLFEAHLKRSVSNEKDDFGLSFLHIACAMADVDIVRQLVEQGEADVNEQVRADCDSAYAGSTPLHMAVEFGNFEVIEYLLEQDANVYVTDREWSTPIHLALELGETDIIDLLFNYDDERLNCTNDSGLSHLMAACASSNPEIAKDFLANKFIRNQFFNANESVKGVDGTTENTLKGFTPLHFAAIFGRFEIAKYLLDDGANCCAVTHNITPLQFATRNGHHDVADLIRGHCQGFEWFLEC